MVPARDCTGCSACCGRCPEHAIAMVEDREGFLYPRIDSRKCSECGLCVAICPVESPVPVESTDAPLVYAGWTTDRSLLRRSSSGGVFSEIARRVLQDGGVVFGAAYGENMVVRHVAVQTWEDLDRLRGSKYVQADVGDTYRQASEFLDAGRQVLYSGTPCQIAGLYAAIGTGHPNLLTCDLICKGVPSPRVFRMHVESLERRYRSGVTGVFFRDKQDGWLHPAVCIAMANGRTIVQPNRDDRFNIGFQKNIYLRPSCYTCPMKTRKSAADITLGDFWELSECQPQLVNPEGTSAVVVNTHSGIQAIEDCKHRLSLTRCPFTYLQSDSMLRKCVKMHPDRTAFFADLDRLSFEELARKYMQPRAVLLRHLAKLRRRCLRWVNRMKRR